MASKLVPERPLMILPTLAATIGLEEALLLQLLADLLQYRHGVVRDQRKWVEISDPDLQALLPFWTMSDIRRIEASLRNLGLILRRPETPQRDSYLYAMNERSEGNDVPLEKVIATQQPVAISRVGADSKSGFIPLNWQPGPDWVSQCRQHSIPDEFTRSLIPEFVAYWRDRGQTRFSWGNAFYKHVLRSWRKEQTRQGARELASRMHGDWLPSQDAVEILENAGINPAFIEDAVPEFVLYWRERGIEVSTWNTKFIEHVRRQWDKFTASFGYDDTPRPIPEDWQPSAACFDILQLAEIDAEYARSKISEFVLYWRDSQQARASWNTVFLQFIKQQWSRRLSSDQVLETGYAENQYTAGANQQRIRQKIEQYTDRSWAE